MSKIIDERTGQTGLSIHGFLREIFLRMEKDIAIEKSALASVSQKGVKLIRNFCKLAW